jgi:hypothetical protein
MSQNLKRFLQEEACYSADELVEMLAKVVPGRGVGERYVVSTEYLGSSQFVMEMDDGCRFRMTCEKLN